MTRSELSAIYEQMDLLLKNLDQRLPLDAKIRQAANDLNLALRVVQRELPHSEMAKGMRELMENDTVETSSAAPPRSRASYKRISIRPAPP